jgi:protein TonB
MIAPRLLVKVEPEYPHAARVARLSGKVELQAVIGLDGSVESADVLRSTSALFDEAALRAVRLWRYEPARMDGRPVRVYFTVVVTFVVR